MVPARPPGTRVGSVDSAPVSKAAKRERQRLNREARKEIENRIQKRRRTMRTARGFAIFAVPVIILGVILSVTNSSSSSSSGVSCKTIKTPPAKAAKLTAPPLTIDQHATYTATIQTTCGTITASLDAAQYPKAVNNFVTLANQGFYDNLAFVRAAKGFVVQAGSPDQAPSGGPGYTAQAETPTTTAGASAYPIGTLAFAKTGQDPAGAVGSQFFIVTGAKGPAGLIPDYAVFGQITKGLNVAQKIESFSPSSGDGTLTSPVVITKVAVVSVPGTATPSSS
jgi:cyclophilin family peptidyl-prolyl cis-trans isomerase